MCSLKRIEIARNRKEIVISRISKKKLRKNVEGKIHTSLITDFSASGEARNLKKKKSKYNYIEKSTL